ncbi:hypothetical protein D3C85_1022190 [compost metagenome]
MFAAVDGETGGVGRHQEGRQALLAQLRIGDGEDDGKPGAFAVADELLGAIQHPVAIAQLGAGAQVVGFGAGLRLGQAEAADRLAAGQVREPEILLRLAAEIQDRAATDRVMNTHQRTDGAIAGGDFFHGQGIGDVIDVAAAPFFGHHHAEQAQLAHLRYQGVIDPAGFLHGLGLGRDLATGEVAGHVADHALLFTQFEVVHRASLLCCGAQALTVRRDLPGEGLKPAKKACTRAGSSSARVAGFQHGFLSLSMIRARTPSIRSPLSNHW